jgi:ribosomal-protein-alanine N-acetyltransferase
MLKLNLYPTPALHTARLKLRPIIDTDAPEIFAMRGSPEVMKYADRDPASSLAEVEEWITNMDKLQQKNETIMWGITLHNTDTLIGTIGFWHMQPEHYRAEIAYMLIPDYQGKGLMAEAITEVTRHAFDKIKLHSIEANVNPANQASITVLQKTNFVREGYFKESFYYNGKFLDSAIYSLICSKK